jgi:hypothetical protein
LWTAIALYHHFSKPQTSLGLTGLAIAGIGLLCGIYAAVKARTFVYGVIFSDGSLTVQGCHFNTRWQKPFDISRSTIHIEAKGNRSGRGDCFFTIRSEGQTVEINRSMNWDDAALLIIFNEFKRIKGEKIIYDEKYFLDMMTKDPKVRSRRHSSDTPV